MVRGFVLEVAAFLCVVPIVFESRLPGPWWAWGGSFLGLSLILVIAGVTLTIRSFARTKREKAEGYTTVWKVAKENPTLVFIDGKDGMVISGAGESRPSTGRRKDLEAAKARQR